ncbi:DUF3644 domain-containing protein [Telmatobacter bradus]|uniref:DUF3644 domain-containing protein n=1 Tax=Telmatobacter bradus TaxID=474953 RepID=UPI003B432B69
MPKAKRDVAELKGRAINSLVLGIELFNRPHNDGRAEGVLILLHHAFEMLLKAIIKDKTGVVHLKSEKYSYGFDRCLEVAQNQIKVISADERSTLSILDAYRDTSAHYYQEVSEDLLYIQAQAAVTLFDDLLSRAFNAKLADFIPARVLPISTRPPKDFKLLIDSELSQIDTLLSAGSRKGIQAAARLRPILALATASRDDAERVTESELRKVVSRRRRGDDWSIILPEVAQLKLDTDGNGISVYLRIKKDADLAVRVAKTGDPIVGTVIKQEVNIWDKFNLSRDDLGKKLNISGPKISALIIELKIQEDPDCFKVLRRKSTTFKGYSKLALERLESAIAGGINIEATWKKYKDRFSGRKHK